MLLSIVVPFYKYKNYLNECLDSLLNSSFHDFETILVLDHNEENIDDLLQTYSSLNIRVIHNEKHGVASSRNAGIKAAKGNYIYFLDSDDYVLKDTLYLLSTCITNQDIVYGQVNNTWNNMANYLEKQAKKLENLDDEEVEMKEMESQQKIQDFISQYNQPESTLLAYYHMFKKKRGSNNITVLSHAYSRTFLLENNIEFNESLTYYSDFPFIIECLSKAKTFNGCLDAIYVKRRHNDPINYPALRQEENEGRFYERMNSYELSYKKTNNEILTEMIDYKIINYYFRHFVKRLRRSEKPEWKNEYFNRFSEVMNLVSDKAISKYSKEKQKMIASLKNKDLNKTLKLVRTFLGKKKLKNMTHNKNTMFKLAYYHVYLKKPILKNVVLFETFNAKNYSDSPKYIYEYLASHYGDQYEFVWALNNGAKPKYGGKVVKRFSFEYAYYLARAQYLVFNVRPPLWYRKREGQTFLETWHGTPLKRLVFDQEEVTAASPKYKQQFYKQRKDWDYLISANDFSTETFARCFMYEGEILDIGYPRNDILYAPNKEELAVEIKKKLNIPLDKKVILYAPTWRDDEYYGKGQYKFELQLDCKMLKEKIGNEYVLLLRTHQYISDRLDTTGLEGFAINVSQYDDISELYLISDICITDYSSVFFDFANLKRPILFYTYDIEKYKNQLRGFYIDMTSEVPGPLLYTNEEVLYAIEHIDEVEQQYSERYQQFYDRFCHLDDGNASKRCVERVFLNKKD
ncbi:CDP-glycerol:glycerophosphate glycerophosphotransferase [Floccifex sp.]|uniref:CDP-glycerol:glycerophosphate glycerophosphotransferase n=1 Tax=Floccifex sp. TaxID=2815810 RepID=UPI003F0B553E